MDAQIIEKHLFFGFSLMQKPHHANWMINIYMYCDCTKYHIMWLGP